MPTYDGIGSSVTHEIEVVGDVFISNVEGGSLSTQVPFEIFSNVSGMVSPPTDSRQLRLRVQPTTEASPDDSYVTDMGIQNTTDNYFFITAPQNTSSVGDQNTFVISKTSNVGIGTTDPEKPLHVVGDSWITGTLTASNIIGASPVTISSSIVMAAGTTLTTGAIEPPAGSESNLKITGTITTSNIVANSGDNLLVNSNLEVGTSNLFVDTTTGRVGIGTDSPATALDVTGKIRVGSTATNVSDSAYLSFEEPAFTTDRFIYTSAIINYNENAYFTTGIVFGNGPTRGADQISMVTSGATRLYINYAGNVGVGTNGPQTTFQVVSSGTTLADRGAVAAIATDNTSFGTNYALLGINCKKAASSTYRFLQCNSSYGTSGSLDAEFILYGHGIGNADGSWVGGGADYAEMFEWEDGNPDNEDRIGLCVKLSENKIKLMEENDDISLILGVVSKTGGFIGDAAELKWNKKYLKDDFGRYLEEEYYIYNWTDEDGKFHSYAHDDVPSELIVPESKETIKSNRRILNPEYNPSDEYIPRSNRIEWETIGLFGKIRIRKGQPVKNTWIKLRNISDHVEEWFVR
jgi:hypothetical protein